MSSIPCVWLCLADSVSSLGAGEAGAPWEHYPSLFVDAVVPSPFEIFNRLLDKIAGPDLDRADPDLRMRLSQKYPAAHGAVF